jgi:hypothetical protein
LGVYVPEGNYDFLIPISIGIDSGSVHDIVILNDQLEKLKEKHPILFKNKVNLILDAGYDSKKLKEQVKNLNLGRVVCYSPERAYTFPKGTIKIDGMVKRKKLLKIILFMIIFY